MTSILYVLLVVFGIGLLIFIHEFGHFLCARMIGVRVEVFALGFGPRLFGITRNGTDYRVAAVPLGGYVQVAGQDPGDNRYPPEVCLHSKTVGQRFLFFSGGVVMNLLFALVAFPIVFHSGVAFRAPVVGEVPRGTAAWEAGLQMDDRILAVNGKEMYSAANMAVEIALAGHRVVTLKVRRGGEEFLVDVQPHYNAAAGLYELGVGTPIADEPPVLHVEPSSPAYRAGLRSGDLLLTVDGESASSRNVQEALQREDPDEPMQVTVSRSGTTVQAVVDPVFLRLDPPVVGITPLKRIVQGIRPGLDVVEDLGLLRGDVVLAVDGERYIGPDLSVAGEGGPRLAMTVLRDGQEVRLSAPVTPEERAALIEHVALRTDPDSLVIEPQPDTPAMRAGIRPGDRILAIDGESVSGWEEMARLIQAVGASADEQQRPEGVKPVPAPRALAMTLDRGGERVALRVRPEQRPVFDAGFEARRILLYEVFQREGFAASMRAGLVSSVDLIKQLYVTLKRLFTGDVSARNLGGIITISRVSYQFAKQGPSRFFYFLALLSINLAFINVLPIPVLDGGHLLFLVIEKVKGSPVNARVFTYAQVLGLIFVLALIVFVTYNDILRLL